VQLLEENISRKRSPLREFELTRFNNWARTHQSRLLRTLRGAQTTRGENSFDRLDILGRSQQAHTPFLENLRDLVGIFFSDEFVEPSVDLEQRGVEWRLAPVMRMKVELGRCRSIMRIRRKDDIAQAWGNQRCRGSLTTPDQKVAAAGVEWMRTDKMTRLIPPTQRKTPRFTFVESKI